MSAQEPETAPSRPRDAWPGFFVVGTGRCGSTLLRKLLRCHPDVYLPKETHWLPILLDLFGEEPIRPEEFFAAVRSVYMAKGRTAYARILKENGLDAEDFERDFAPRIAALDRPDLAAIMTAFYDELARRNGAGLWGDKTPDYGLCMTRLQRLWPSAKFLHIVRDGRDVALSMSRVLSFRLLVAFDVWFWPTIAWQKAYATRLDQAAADRPIDDFFGLWRRRLLRIRDEAKRLVPGSHMEIDYDALLADPVVVLERVSAFLGLPARPGWIETAAARVRRDERGKNSGGAGYGALTERHGTLLRDLGFRR